MTDQPRITRCGKQLMLDGNHLADAIDERAAEAMEICLNHAGMAGDRWPSRERVTVQEFFA